MPSSPREPATPPPLPPRQPVRPAAAAPPQSSLPPTRLYIDALNYTDSFFNLANPYEYGNPQRSITAFTDAAAASGISLRVFIDEGIATGEAEKKWRKRREREVADGEKRVPHGLSWLYGDMWRRAGVQVTYSYEADNDDAIAAAAQADGADVLSNDRDFFRYRGASFRVFADFRVVRGRLILTRHDASAAQPGAATRELISPPPAGVPEDAAAPWLPLLLRTRQYRRGAPSPLVQALGFNPHIRAAPLRHALFSRIFRGAGGPAVVTEEFPVWDTAARKVAWHVASVDISRVLDSAEVRACESLLDGLPAAAFASIFPQESAGGPKPAGAKARDWAKHCCACRAVVYELCAAATRCEFLSLLLA